MSGDTWKRGDLDFTGAMMILFLRAVALCTNRADGAALAASGHTPDGTPPADTNAAGGGSPSRDGGPGGIVAVKPDGDGAAGASAPQQSQRWARRRGPSAYLQERSIRESPDLLSVASFFFANGNLLGGPFFEYKEWDQFLHRSGAFYEVRINFPMVIMTRNSTSRG